MTLHTYDLPDDGSGRSSVPGILHAGVGPIGCAKYLPVERGQFSLGSTPGGR